METNLNKSCERRKRILSRMIDENSTLSKKHNLLPEQFSALKEYDRQNQLRKLSIASRLMYLYHLQYFAERVKKPFDKITRKDIEDFLLNMENLSQSSQTKARTCIKAFFAWLYKCEDRTYPEVVRWIKTNKRFIKTKQPDDLLTMEEIKRMLSAADHPRTVALVHTLAETGARVGEISNTKIKDAAFDEYGILLHVNGKTGERKIRLTDCVPSLRNWLNVHPEKNNPEAPLFINLGKNQYGGGLSEIGIEMIVKLVAKRAGIKKNVYPHLFRHSRATQIAREGYNEHFMREFFGWSDRSDMPALYISMSAADIDNVMLVKKGLKKSNSSEANGKILESVKCPRCTEFNAPTNVYCSKCAMPLDEESRKEKSAEELIKKAITGSPEIMKMLKDAIEKIQSDIT